MGTVRERSPNSRETTAQDAKEGLRYRRRVQHHTVVRREAAPIPVRADSTSRHLLANSRRAEAV